MLARLLMKFMLYGLLVVFYLLQTTQAYAQSAPELRVRQGNGEYPALKLYGNILNADGGPMENLSDGQFKVMINDKTVPVQSLNTFPSTGEGVAYILLIDVSASLKHEQAEGIKATLKGFVDRLTDADVAAVMTFGNKVEILQDFTGDHQNLRGSVEGLIFHDEQTQLYHGVLKAMDFGRRKGSAIPARKVIIALSDGQDDFMGGPTKDEALQGMKEDRIPVYTIGISSINDPKERDKCFKILGELARASGGNYYSADNLGISQIYHNIMEEIRQAFVLEVDAAASEASGKAARVQVYFNDGQYSLTDGIDVRLWATDKKAEDDHKKPWWQQTETIYGTLVSLALFLVVSSTLLYKKNAFQKKEGPSNAATDGAPFSGGYQPLLSTDMNRVIELERSGNPVQCTTQSSSTVSVRLTVIRGSMGTKSRDLIISGRITIGRSMENDVVLADDLRVSGQHCAIIVEDSQLFIQDLQSKNHTFVNGASIRTRTRIFDGDIISIGSSELRLTLIGYSR